MAVRPNRKEWSSFNTPSSFRGHRRTRFSFISFSDKNFTILFSFVFQCSLQFCDAVLSYLPPSHFLAFFDVLSRAPSSERSGRLRTVPLFPPFIYFSCLAPPLLIRRVTLGSTFSGYWQISGREISLRGGGGASPHDIDSEHGTCACTGKSLGELVVRRNAVRQRSDWTKATWWTDEFYRQLRTAARSYDETEHLVSQLLDMRWTMLPDRLFRHVDV